MFLSSLFPFLFFLAISPDNLEMMDSTEGLVVPEASPSVALFAQPSARFPLTPDSP